MVEGFAHVSIKDMTETIRLNPLEIAQIYCDRKGFDVVDAEPTGTNNQWRIKAYSNKGKAVSSVSVTGASLTEAVSRLIERLW